MRRGDHGVCRDRPSKQKLTLEPTKGYGADSSTFHK